MWLRHHMLRLVKEIYLDNGAVVGDSLKSRNMAKSFLASHHWRVDWAKRFGVVVRRKTNKRQKTLHERIGLWQKFHQAVLKLISSANTTGKLVPVYGAFLPHEILSSDQIPLPFVIGDSTTFEEKGAKQVSIVQPGDGLEKRQATIQIISRCYEIVLHSDTVLDAITGLPNAAGRKLATPKEVKLSVQCRVAIIFKGKGMKITAEERNSYHPNVDVYFQVNAWFDTATALKWSKGTVKPFVLENFSKDDGKNITPTLHFLDNLSSQTSEGFRHYWKNDLNSTLMFYPPGETDNLAPIDAGLGKDIKMEMYKCRDEWMEKTENLEQWMNGKFSASERRVLMCNWLGAAVELVNKKHYANFRYFERTGCLQRIDGTPHRMDFDGLNGPYDMMTEELRDRCAKAVDMAKSGDSFLSLHGQRDLDDEEPAGISLPTEVEDADFDDDYLLATELDDSLGDEVGEEQEENNDEADEEEGEDNPVLEGGVCSWGDAVGGLYDIVPYNPQLLQSRGLSSKLFARALDGIGWVVGKFVRKAYGVDVDDNDCSYRVNFGGEGETRVIQILQFNTDLYQASASDTMSVDGAWCLLEAKSVAVMFSVGQEILADWKGHGNWYPGKIEAAHADKTYDVIFDDGDREEKKVAASIKARP